MQITRCHKGFTLVELILSILIIAIVAGLVGPMLTNGIRGYALVAKRRAALSQARLVMDRMASELRLIPTTNDIVAFTATSITFNTPSESNIAYSLSSTNLMRSGSILADGISSLGFTYLDANGNPTATKASIKRIGVEIVASAGGTFGSVKVRSQTFPRRFSSAYAGFQ